MRIGIISDIHGNIEAIEAVIVFLDDKIDFLVSLGDVVGYGPDPEECVNLILKEADVVLKGNHEEGIVTEDLSRFKNTARVSLEWTKNRLSSEIIEKLKNLSEKEVKDDTCFVHASISSPLFKYILCKEDTEEEFSLLTQRICFFGHTHIPGGFRRNVEDGSTEVIYTDFSGKMALKIDDGFVYLINVGSVGQPRDGLPFACVGIYNTDKRTFTLHRLEYPVEKTRKKIIERGLPSILARRIVQGI
jgi:predicted phosphodiesterase